MHCYGSSGNGKAVTPVNGDNSKGVNQLDSNMILKVSRDRECSEWLTFESNIGYVSTSKDFSLNNNNSNIKTCVSLNEDKTCNTEHGIGSGYEEKLDVRKYISDMKGEWANNDYSGFAIPMLESVDKATWGNRQIVTGSTSIFTANEKYAKNQVCKSYPESDSPYNFSDKYEIKLRKCGNSSNEIGVVGNTSVCSDDLEYDLVEVNRNQALWGNGDCNDWCVVKGNTTVYSDRTKKKVLAFTYEQFKEFVPRRYFGDTVKSGITLPYENNRGPVNEFLIWIDDNQECYYQKFTYNNKPQDQYFGDNEWNLPTQVCYTPNSSGQGGDVNIAGCQDSFNRSDAVINKEKTSFNNINNDSKRGYCIEYSYSNEIYYPNSGKYNCITWIPGYVK